MISYDELLAERECHRLVMRYVRYVDKSDGAIAQLFTSDARLKLQGRPDLRGRDEIRAYFENRPPEFVTLHLCGNLVVDVTDANSATGTSDLAYFRVAIESGDDRATNLSPVAIGSYHDIFVRTPDGWRIADREFRMSAARR